MPKIERDGLYRVSEVAVLLAISERSVQRLIQDGRLPARKLGRVILVRGCDLLDALPEYERRKG